MRNIWRSNHQPKALRKPKAPRKMSFNGYSPFGEATEQFKVNMTTEVDWIVEQMNLMKGKPNTDPKWAAIVRRVKSLQSNMREKGGWSDECVGMLCWGDKKYQSTTINALLRPALQFAATYLTTTQAQELQVASSNRGSRAAAADSIDYAQQPHGTVVDTAREVPAVVVEAVKDTTRPASSSNPVENPTRQVKSQLTTEINNLAQSAPKMSPGELLGKSTNLMNKLNGVAVWNNNCTNSWTCNPVFESKPSLYGKIGNLVQTAKQRQGNDARTAASQGLTLTKEEQKQAALPPPAAAPTAAGPAYTPPAYKAYTPGGTASSGPVPAVPTVALTQFQMPTIAIPQINRPAASPQFIPGPAAPSTNNTLLIAGIAGGATLLLLILVMAMR